MMWFVRTRGAGLLASCILSLAALAFAGGPGFRTDHLLQDHFEKYGHEFGDGITQQQYLRLAQQLRDSHAGKDILEFRRKDGAIRFDRKHGYFGAYDPDGTIRTFFIPSDGVRYFEREAR
jgi:pyocin large subunit-like protein